MCTCITGTSFFMDSNAIYDRRAKIKFYKFAFAVRQTAWQIDNWRE